MKKFIPLLLAAILSISGCGGKEAVKAIDVKATAESIVKAVPFNDDMIALSEKIAGDFYDLTFEGLKSYCIYTSGTRASASELTVFELTDEKNMDAAKKSIESRLNDQKESYKDYVPAEMARLEGALILQKGNYLLCVVSDDNAAAQKLFEDAFK